MAGNKEDSVLLSSGISVPVSRKRVAPSDEGNADQHGQRLIDKVNNVWGSTAGAGSDFFHTYRKHRTVEMQRLKKLDEDDEEEKEEQEFQKRRQELANLNTERASKSASKRQKLKQRREKVKEQKKLGAQLNTFNSDGTFLTQFLDNKNENQQRPESNATTASTPNDATRSVSSKLTSQQSPNKVLAVDQQLSSSARQELQSAEERRLEIKKENDSCNNPDLSQAEPILKKGNRHLKNLSVVRVVDEDVD